MNNRAAKKIRREAARARAGAARATFNALCCLPFRERIKASGRILIGWQFPPMKGDAL